MTNFFVMIGLLWSRILSLFSEYSFTIGGYTVSLFTILLSALVWSILIAVFWKGAKA